MLGDVLRLRLDAHVGGKSRGRRLHQRIPAGQGSGARSDRRAQRFQHRPDPAQAPVPTGKDYTRGATPSEQGRVS